MYILLDNSATWGSERLKDVCDFTQLISAPSSLKMTSGYTELTCSFHWVNTADIGKNKAGVIPRGENKSSPSLPLLLYTHWTKTIHLQGSILDNQEASCLPLSSLLQIGVERFVGIHIQIYMYIYTHTHTHTHIYKCLALETVSQSAAALIHIAFLHKSEKPELLLRKRALCWEPQPPSPHFLSWSPLSWLLPQHLSSDQPWNSFKSWPLSSRF